MAAASTVYLQGAKTKVVIKNIIDYLNNHWTKARLVCTCFDWFFVLMQNMDMIDANFVFWKYFILKFVESVLDQRVKSARWVCSIYRTREEVCMVVWVIGWEREKKGSSSTCWTVSTSLCMHVHDVKPCEIKNATVGWDTCNGEIFSLQ